MTNKKGEGVLKLYLNFVSGKTGEFAISRDDIWAIRNALKSGDVIDLKPFDALSKYPSLEMVNMKLVETISFD